MDHVIALRQISVTAQCYSSILFRRQQENPSLRHEGTAIQRCEEKSAPARVRGELALAPLFICFSLPGPVLCKLGQPGVLFILPEVLTPVLGPSVPFLQAFPFLVLQPPPFWTPFPCSTYLTLLMFFKNYTTQTHSVGSHRNSMPDQTHFFLTLKTRNC